MKGLFLPCFLLMVQFLTAQNVGIGTTSPKARLHVADSSVLFSGAQGLPGNAGVLPASGSGIRMMWLPTKAAFRAGGVATTQWNEGNIGNYSAAFGQNNIAKGDYSFVAGSANSASGHAGLALGGGNSASGKFSLALGYQAEATAFGSVVIGRYNVIAGNSETWEAADPLFVVGNGYLEEISPGIGQIVRRNALTINKSGVAFFTNDIRAEDDLRVSGNGVFEKTVNLHAGAVVDGSGIFHDNLFVNGKLSADTIENLKVMNAEYANGTTPEVNLVPLGVVAFRGYYSVSPLNNSPSTTYTNLAANFVTSVTGLYNEGLGIGIDAVVGIRLNFNTAKVGDYKEVIAVGHSYFDGIGTSGNTTLSATGTFVSKDEVTGKPVSCTILFKSSGLPTAGDFSSSGTYMFYGLK